MVDLRRVPLAATAAITTFRRVIASTAEPAFSSQASRASWYELLRSYYDSTVFDDAKRWALYKKHYGLYRAIRSLYNPVSRIVDTYAANVYPGVLSEDGSDLPEGIPAAIPLAADTPAELRDAIAQLWQWSNWQSLKTVLVRWGAMTGNVLAEIEDDLDRGKMLTRLVWPGEIDALDLDTSGNVRRYAVQYSYYDRLDKTTHIYRREVDVERFQTWRDGKPFAYGDQGASWPNFYGFVPATWTKHKDVGDDFGASCFEQSLPQIDELASLASHLHDGVHKLVANPVIFWSDGDIEQITGGEKRPGTEEFESPYAQREEVLILKGPAGGRIESLASVQRLVDASPFLDKLIADVEHRNPEATLWQQLRSMSTVTGPGAARLVQDATGPIYEAQALYDLQLVKLYQMQCAISGERLRRGDWPDPTPAQQKFAAFNLQSYARGELNFAIRPRPIVQKTTREKIDELVQLGAALGSFQTVGIPPEVILKRELGWSDEDVAELTVAATEAIARQQTLAAADTPDGVEQ